MKDFGERVVATAVQAGLAVWVVTEDQLLSWENAKVALVAGGLAAAKYIVLKAKGWSDERA